MICRPGIFLALFLSCHLAAAPGDGNWAVKGAPWRIALSAENPPDGPGVGWQIRLPDFGGGRDDMRDVVLFGKDNKEIGLHGIWRSAGRTLLMLAESIPQEGGAILYFGGKASRRMNSWTATPSLMMETRRMPDGANIATSAGWREAWGRSTSVDGVAFVPSIFHGGNPFGAESRYLTRYTGLLKSGDGGERKFYSLSDDVSYVTIDSRQILQWQKNQPPPRDPRQVPLSTVHLKQGFARVEYCHAAVDAPGAMVLGWQQEGKLGNVPPEAWVHPGAVKPGAFESADGAPVPLANLEALSYLGFGGEWYVRLKAGIPDPGPDWQVDWLWPDGRIDHGLEIHRLWMSLEPVKVIVRLRKDSRAIEGRRLLVIPREMKAASVNHQKELAEFLDLLERENPASLPEAAKKAGFTLAANFAPSSKAAQWAEAWIAASKPSAGPWVSAMSMAIRETARSDPKVALLRLNNLTTEARAAMGAEADLLELDIRVFSLNDPGAAGLAARLKQSPDKSLARMAMIRLGDSHLLNGRIDDAARCFAEAVSGGGEDTERKAPALDRAHSLALESLIDGKHTLEARAKLDAWERLRPSAKLDGDMLLWRARVMFLAQDWNRALQDLETSLKVRPGAPEEIEMLFWQGRALYELGRKDEARKVWKALVNDYPKHERAEAAKSWAEKP